MSTPDHLTLGTALYLLGWVVSFVFSYQILRERRSPSATVGWIAFIFLLPWVGIAIYLLIGARKLKRPKRQRARPLFDAHSQLPLAQAAPLDKLLRRLGAAGASDNNTLTLHVDAATARAGLLAVIESAQQELYVLIYTLADDSVGREVLAAMTRAAQRGVRVRLLVDDIGSFNFRAAGVRQLRAAGGEMLRFKPVWDALARRVANLRNHRKIVVADGARAWFGGRNISDDYLDSSVGARWVDLSVSVTGSAARAFEAICIADWAFSTDTDVPPPRRNDAAHSGAGAVMQVLASGPDLREDVWHTAFIKACFEANQRLWIVTPYFVPDEAALGAISTAARSGVDVRLIVPTRSDSRLVDMVSASYLRDLERLNVRVFRYGSGMAHAKMVLVDDTIGCVGSANLDARSFFLNYEVVGVSYDAKFNAELAQFFSQLEARCERGVRPVRATTELLTSTLRILSPML